MNSRLSGSAISDVFQRAIRESGLITKSDTALLFHDLSFLESRIRELKQAFPSDTLHCIAVKANPLLNILKHIRKNGAGLEAATLPELHLAVAAGVPADKIVFDSPAKTMEELEYAIGLGCHINADSIEETERIAGILARIKYTTKSTFGLRINPQVGTGHILSTSVAGEYSKFGVPVTTQRTAILAQLQRYDWLTGLHIHIGSQGCPPELLLEGVRVVTDIASEFNKTQRKQGKAGRISIIDLGGGLPVAYLPGSKNLSMKDYSNEIRKRFPELDDGTYKLITEFGRYVHANAGWAAARVEYVKREPDRNTAIIHLGADMFLRECYRPEDWQHEIIVADQSGRLKTGNDEKKYVIAGPLCFAGDMIARDIELPAMSPGDYIIIKDSGAYTMSMWSRYNSRQMPKVIGYTENGRDFELIKDRETAEDLVAFWS